MQASEAQIRQSLRDVGLVDRIDGLHLDKHFELENDVCPVGNYQRPVAVCGLDCHFGFDDDVCPVGNSQRPVAVCGLDCHFALVVQASLVEFDAHGRQIDRFQQSWP